jgi:hypothetical protein
VDEGQIVYPIWRTALGAVPYRDFGHAYWPSLFVVNGALMRAFGEDLAVMRAALVALKAVIALAVFRLASRVSRGWIAVVAWGLALAVWGSPVWIFNTPYANHYALALGLGAALVLSGGRGASPSRAVLAGLLTGLAATFKHTTGAFLSLAGLVFLAAELRPLRGRNALRGAAAALAGLVVLLYVLRPPRTWTGGVIVMPALAVIVRTLGRDAGGAARPGDLVGFSAGVVSPVIACLFIAQAFGVLPAMLRETLTGLGAHLTWGQPLPAPRGNLLAAVAAVLATAAAFGAWRRGRPGRAVAVATAAAGAAAWAWTVTGTLAVAALHWLPLLAVGLAVAAWWAGAPEAVAPDARGRAIRLVVVLAAFALLTLHPGADLPHALMVLPAALPPAAWLADRLVGPPGTPPVRAATAATLIMVLAAGMAWPFLAHLWTVRTMDVRDVPRFARATGVLQPGRRTEDVARLLARLDALSPPGAPVVVLPTAQMIYVLAGRPSAIERDEFALYMIATDIVPPAAAPTLIDQEALVARLASQRPLVVVDRTEPALGRLREGLPALARFLDTRCDPAGEVGPFLVCRVVVPA